MGYICLVVKEFEEFEEFEKSHGRVHQWLVYMIMMKTILMMIITNSYSAKHNPNAFTCLNSFNFSN